MKFTRTGYNNYMTIKNKKYCALQLPEMIFIQ